MAKGPKVELFFFSFQVYDPGLFKSHCQGDKEEEKKKPRCTSRELEMKISNAADNRKNLYVFLYKKFSWFLFSLHKKDKILLLIQHQPTQWLNYT